MITYSYQITNNSSVSQPFTLNGQTFHVNGSTTISLTVTDPIVSLPSTFSYSLVNADGSLTPVVTNTSNSVSSNASTFVDRSGVTNAVAGKYNQVSGVNLQRRYFRLINTSPSVIYLYDKSGVPTQASSIPIPPGTGFIFDAKVTSTAIQIMSLAPSCTFEAAEG